MADENRKLLHIEVGPVQIDVPQSVGYFGGIAAAMALGMIEPPLAACIAVVPLIKILADPGSPVPVRFIAEILQGATKPIGGDAEGTVRLAQPVRARRETAAVEAAATPRTRAPRAGSA